MCSADSLRLNPAPSVNRASAPRQVRDPRGQLLFAALVCWLSAYLNVAGGEAPQPKMVIPASFAQAPVSADGKHVVLVAAATSRAEDLSQSQMSGELRIVDLETGRTIATRPVPQEFLGVAPEWRRSVTPDARHYGWLDNDRWLVVSRVMDGEEVHRVDLNAMGLLATACADTMRISDDGNFIIARNRRHGPEGWMRIDLDAPPRVAATLATSRREDVLHVDLAGDREHGRMAVLTKRKKDICLQLMDMEFERLAELASRA